MRAPIPKQICKKRKTFVRVFMKRGQRDIDNFIRVQNKIAASLKKLRLTGEKNIHKTDINSM